MPQDEQAHDPQLHKLPVIDPAATQGLEPGRALALADFAAPALGAGERLLRMAYRLGVPGSMLTMPMGRRKKAPCSWRL